MHQRDSAKSTRVIEGSVFTNTQLWLSVEPWDPDLQLILLFYYWTYYILHIMHCRTYRFTHWSIFKNTARNGKNLRTCCLMYPHPWTLRVIEQDQQGQPFKRTVCHEEY